MSALLMGRSFYVPVDQSSKLVLLALCDHANEDGAGARPGLARLSAKTGLQRRSVQTALAHLEAHGLIVARGYRKGGRGHATNWVVSVGLLRVWADLFEDDPAEWERVQQMHSSGGKGCIWGRKGCTVEQERVHDGAPQPSGTIKNREEFSNDEEYEPPPGGYVAEFHRRITS